MSYLADDVKCQELGTKTSFQNSLLSSKSG